MTALLGKGWLQIVHPDDVADAASWPGHIRLPTGDPYEVEFRIRRADGAYRWHLVRAQPIRLENGEIIQWVGANTDIEDQRVATDALAALNADLEQRVAERTAERDRVWRNSRDLLAVVDGAGDFPRGQSGMDGDPGPPAGGGGRPQHAGFRMAGRCGPTQAGLDIAAAQRDLTNFENRYPAQGWHAALDFLAYFG